jgi:signal transduction histidine kinase
MDFELRRVTMLANGAYLIVGSIVAFYLLASLPRYLQAQSYHFMSIIPVIVLAVVGTSLVLNYFHYYLFSRISFVIVWILLTSVLIPVVLGTRVSDHLVHPWYALISCVLVQILFSYDRERWIFLSFFSVTLFLTVFSFDFINLFLLPGETMSNAPVGRGWSFFVAMVAVFFNAAVWYVMWLNRQFFARVRTQHEIIQSKNDQLRTQHKQLEELAKTLEEKVIQRTAQLQKQNAQLLEYAHFNSHVLRAPVSRIRGLLNLLQMPLDNGEEKRIRELLGTCMLELDGAIRQANDQLEAPVAEP